MKIAVPTMNGYLFDCYGNFAPPKKINELKANPVVLFLFSLQMRQKKLRL